MTATGTVNRVRRKNFCFIKKEDGEVFYAHKDFFLNPADMQEGARVSFTPVPQLAPGKNSVAMNVKAIAA